MMFNVVRTPRVKLRSAMFDETVLWPLTGVDQRIAVRTANPTLHIRRGDSRIDTDPARDFIGHDCRLTRERGESSF